MKIGPDDVFTAAQLFDASRLTLARELRGLTKAELASKIDKSPSAVSQFEGARTRPDAQTLRRLSLSLGIPVSFFVRRNAIPLIPLEGCHFRSLRSASQRDRRRLLANAALLCELIDHFEEHVEFPSEQVTAVASAPTSDDDIERIAVEVRRRWGFGLGPIPNMTKLLESKGIIVLPIDATCREVDAFSFWQGKRPCVFLLMDKHSASRSRFDAAHELGHLVMHADVSPGSADVEKQAHRFASAFLLPKESFLPECPNRFVFEHFLELKRRWLVSIAGLVRRAHDLGRLSEASYRRAYVYLNRTNQRRAEPGEPALEPPTLVPHALAVAAEDLSLSQLSEKMCLGRAELDALLSPFAR